MDNERSEEMQEGALKRKNPRFNAGGNDADYDGGHPSGFGADDGEQPRTEDEDGGSFNAGGNDSDFDGGHPGEKFPSKKQ